MTHICVGKLTIIGSDNGLSPGRRQSIIWISAGILLIGPLGTNFNEIVIEILTFSFKKMHLKMSSGKWRPYCLGHNVLNSSLWSHHLIRNTNQTANPSPWTQLPRIYILAKMCPTTKQQNYVSRCHQMNNSNTSYKNIERHIAHTIVSWPTPKQ